MAEGMSWASERFHNRKGGLWSGISILHILFASCLATHNDGQQREISVTFRNTLRNTIPRPTAEREWSRESPAWRDRYQSFVFPRLLCPLFLLIFAELPLLKPINTYADLLDFHKNWPECSWDINKPKYARLKRKFQIFLSWSPRTWQQPNYSLLSNFKIDFLKNHLKYRKSFTRFVNQIFAEWYCLVCVEVRGDAEAGNSVE